MSIQPGKKLTVFSIKQSDKGSIWVRAGTAWVNRDGSLNVYLDVLPLDGKLHIREEVGGSPNVNKQEEP